MSFDHLWLLSISMSSVSIQRREGGQLLATDRVIESEISGALRQALKRFKQWRRLKDDIRVLTESEDEPIGRVLTNEQQERLLKTAEANPEWEHVCARRS
jgi:hypothetical protein